MLLPIFQMLRIAGILAVLWPNAAVGAEPNPLPKPTVKPVGFPVPPSREVPANAAPRKESPVEVNLQNPPSVPTPLPANEEIRERIIELNATSNSGGVPIQAVDPPMLLPVPKGNPPAVNPPEDRRLPLLGVPLGTTPKANPQSDARFKKYLEEIIDPEKTLDLVLNRNRVLVFKQAPTRLQVTDETTATITGVATAILIGWASRRERVREDTAIGIVFTGMFALGVVILSRAKTTRNLTDILLGNVLAVTAGDLWMIGAVAVIVATALMLLHKELELTSFDPIHATAIGLNPDRLRIALLILLALTIVTAIQVIGLILTTALLVTPAATASLVTHRLSYSMAVAAIIASIAAVAGLLMSYQLRVPAGAAIVLTTSVLFLAVTILKPLFVRCG